VSSRRDDTQTEGTVEGIVGVGGGLCAAVSAGGPFESYDLPEGAELTIGRSSKCDIRIDDPSVSRQHALLRRDGGSIELRDLGSSNGVRVNGERLEADYWTELEIGQSAEIGNALLVIRPLPASRRPRRIWGHGYFASRIEEECARSSRSSAEFGVLRVGLPGTVSRELAEDVMAGWLRAADVLARYAPGEYEVLYLDLAPARAEVATARLVAQLAARLDCDTDRIRAGLACFPRDGRSAEGLLTRANDLAMGRGDNNVQLGSAILRPGLETQIERIAKSSLSVLILGETGVGKEVCAEAVHALSPRAKGKLLRLNCAALSENLLESELFGHERGSFTGAARSKPGLLETADGGTVFLDEIGELPLSTQVKLLRVLEDRKVQRVGALEPRAIDVRFLAATNRDLEAEVAVGRFRQDLMFRLNAITLHIAPLRERTDEIQPLARRFIELAAHDLGVPAPSLTQGALDLLMDYPWPGNVRELRNMMERAVVLSGGDHIDATHLPVDQMRATVLPVGGSAARGHSPSLSDWSEQVTGEMPRVDPSELEARPVTTTGASLKEDVAEMERQRIIEALDECGGNQSRAAKLLGISRGTLIKRLDKYGIPRPRKRRRS
jgi:DNA-binding NtrC family response regulator